VQQAKHGRANHYRITGRKLSLDVEQSSRLLHEARDRLRQRRGYEIPIGNQARQHALPVSNPDSRGGQFGRRNPPDRTCVYVENLIWSRCIDFARPIIKDN
jgi:hypothetical protein